VEGDQRERNEPERYRPEHHRRDLKIVGGGRPVVGLKIVGVEADL
jgi:hypothetical protein